MRRFLPTLSLERQVCEAVARRIGVPAASISVAYYHVARRSRKGSEIPVFKVPPQARGRARAAGLDII